VFLSVLDIRLHCIIIRIIRIIIIKIIISTDNNHIYNTIFIYNKIIITFLIFLIILFNYVHKIFLHFKDLDQYSRYDILAKFPNDVQCWYAPRSIFVDELMLKAAKMLHINSKIIFSKCAYIKKEIKVIYDTSVQAADSEINLVHLRYSKNDTSKVLWAIFEIDKFTSGKPKTLEYKIRSSEIGENQMIIMHEEEPAYKGRYSRYK